VPNEQVLINEEPSLLVVIIMLSAIVLAVAAVIGVMIVDQYYMRCETPIRAELAAMLMGVGTGLVVLIGGSLLLKVPGAYGPVQYWHSDPAAMKFMMGPRVVALFTVCGGLLLAVCLGVATLVSLAYPADGRRWHRLIVPGVALAMYGLAYYLFAAYEFFPSA
jgi:hypothetical protein